MKRFFYLASLLMLSVLIFSSCKSVATAKTLIPVHRSAHAPTSLLDGMCAMPV